MGRNKTRFAISILMYLIYLNSIWPRLFLEPINPYRAREAPGLIGLCLFLLPQSVILVLMFTAFITGGRMAKVFGILLGAPVVVLMGCEVWYACDLLWFSW